ncbi:hypothetical protein HML84_19105 [Alcanivorax sp. IO_7]|nr:hypothetical protein HML84_19105 [Alcanivorax sp. IO_7]
MDDNQQQHLEQGTALLLACAGGDGAAFQRLYSIEAPRMLALARRFTGESAAAEDAVQDTFVQVWRNAHRFRRERGSARPGCTACCAIGSSTSSGVGGTWATSDCPATTGRTGALPEQCSLEADRDRRLRIVCAACRAIAGGRF